MTHNPLDAIFAQSSLPRFERLPEALAHWAAVTPESPAVGDDDRRLTYGELAREVARVAAALLKRGIGRGDRIAMLDAPGVDFWVVFLATVSVGAVWVGLNPRHTDDELAYVLGDAEPRLVFARSAVEARDRRAFFDRLAPEWVELDGEGLAAFAEGASDTRAPTDLVGPDDVALLVYTSGSTGRPKGAQLPHRAILHAARSHAVVWQVTPLRVLNNLPINHVGGVCDIGCTALAAGGFQWFARRYDAEGSLVLIERERLTLWGQVPTQFRLSLAVENFADYDLSSLQLIIWSGARAPRELIDALHAICPMLSCSYGMTETVGSVTLAPQGLTPEQLDGSIGWPDPERQVRLAPDGEVQVADAFLMRGYLNRPDAQAFTEDGWFRTGDLAARRPDGSFALVGRAGEMFKSGGYNVYPREVEEALEHDPDIASAVVVGIADPLWDEIGVAFVVPQSAAFDPHRTLDRLRGTLANYKIPKRVVTMDALPLLPVGKVDRAALKRMAVA